MQNSEKTARNEVITFAFSPQKKKCPVLLLKLFVVVLFRFDWKPTAGQTLHSFIQFHNLFVFAFNYLRLIIRPRNAIAFVINEKQGKPFLGFRKKGAGPSRNEWREAGFLFELPL